MNVMVCCSSKFHSFYLAEQLYKRGHLLRLMTSWYDPKGNAQSVKIPKPKVSDNYIGASQIYLSRKIPFFKSYIQKRFLAHKYFGHWCASHLKRQENCDLVVTWGLSALPVIRTAKHKGIISIVERGSAHVNVQKALLEQEYQSFGIKPPATFTTERMERELTEYDEANYIEVPSKFVKKTFVKNGIPASKLIRVPYGVDLQEFLQIPKQDKVFRIVYAGSMSLRKGVHYLLQAFAELKLPNAELLLIGRITDEIKPFFKKYEGLFKWIVFKAQNELNKYYCQGSVFIIASIEEGMAMVQAQAMACGLPLICTTNTGGEDLIENGKEGFVIPIRDVEALKEKILFLYENPEICQQMGLAAGKKVQQQFTWDHYGKKIVQEYERILHQQRDT